MTTYGPYKCLTITTPDITVTITGSNMVATVTGCDFITPTQDGFYVNIADVSSQDGGDSETAGPDDYVGDSSASQQFLELSSTSDMESDCARSPGVPWQSPQLADAPSPSVAVSHETTVDLDSGKADDIGTVSDECTGSPYHSESEHGSTPPSSPISSNSEYYTPISSPVSSCSDIDSSDSELSQICEASAEVRQQIGSKRKCIDGEGNGDSEQPLVMRRRAHMCSSIGQVGGATGNTNYTDPNCSVSGLQLQSNKEKCTLRKKAMKRLSCDSCGKVSSTTQRLARHLSTYTKVASHSCNACGKTFTTFQGLTCHCRIHTGERPYSCDTCGKTFIQPGSFSQRVCAHTGKRPCSCDTCDKTFTQSGHLSQHVNSYTH